VNDVEGLARAMAEHPHAAADLLEETVDWELLERFAAGHADVLARLWRIGDGDGGAVMGILRAAVEGERR